MKHCPKCNRTFPDESQKFCTVDGGLLIHAPTFDPNATIRATAAELEVHNSEVPRSPAATSREFLDPEATISLTPTAVFPRNTAPTGPTTTSDLPLSPQPPAAPSISAALAQPKKRSKLPWILGALALLLVFGLAGAVGLFFFIVKPRLEELRDRPLVSRTEPVAVDHANENTNRENVNEKKIEEDTFVPPADAVKFTNSANNLDGKLAEHYLAFSFYYPKTWQTDPKAGVAGASNFVKVERMLPPDYTQENFAVGWYSSKGTFEADLPTFPELVSKLGLGLAQGFPEYRKVSEGPTRVNSLDAYEFRFVSLSKGTEKGDIRLWGRVIFLPTGKQGDTSGATLSMLATSLAPELSGVEDLGEKGEMPVILESFRFGRNK